MNTKITLLIMCLFLTGCMPLSPPPTPQMALQAQKPSNDPLDIAKASIQVQDYEEAFKILQPLAEQGNAMAQVLLGELYQRGQGVSSDWTQAVEWYRKAAEQNNPAGLYHLAQMYEAGKGSGPNEGKGLEKDEKKAYDLYFLAAEQGLLEAYGEVALAHIRGTVVPREPVKAYVLAYFVADCAVNPENGVERAFSEMTLMHIESRLTQFEKIQGKVYALALLQGEFKRNPDTSKQILGFERMECERNQLQ